jgi:hypothetical protein
MNPLLSHLLYKKYWTAVIFVKAYFVEGTDRGD